MSRNALLDFLQAASNEAAGAVSGPVDLLSWGLRKAGVPVPQNSLLSSQWMADKGLTRPVQPGAAQVAGATAGLLSPVAAVAKAPQIARGLLQAGENAAKPRMLNPQMGAIVWHGSPHKFDKFDSSKIGTGEGAQAYGHGLYLAESPGVAEYYRAALAPGQIMKQRQANWNQLSFVNPGGQTINGADVWKLVNKPGTRTPYGKIDRIEEVGGNLTAVAKKANGAEFNIPFMPGQMVDPLAVVSKMPKDYVQTITDGALYKVDLPDEKIARMLDWDGAVSEAQRKPLSQAAMRDFGSGLSGTSGEHLYKEVIFEFKNAGHPNPTQAATDWLRKNGAPGISYLDGGSRSAGSGTKNFVVFPGEENVLKILERNGVPIR